MAVSITLPPASAYMSSMRAHSSIGAPTPPCSPKVIAPRNSSETRRPVRPSSRYRMFDPQRLAEDWLCEDRRAARVICPAHFDLGLPAGAAYGAGGVDRFGQQAL